MASDWIVNRDDLILVTGSNGFIGTRVVRILLGYGFRNLRCFVRPSSNIGPLEKVVADAFEAKVKIVRGNLNSLDDCLSATKDCAIVYHLAAISNKSFASVAMGTIIPTMHLLDACGRNGHLKRFVNVSSFAVYSNRGIGRGGLLDESCPMDREPEERHNAYAYGKIKQDELVLEYAEKYGLPYVIVRPGAVYGPGKDEINGRVGIGTFGFFLHLGGKNRIPFTYVDNCAEAIILAGIIKGVEGEVFNVVDDDLPKSIDFLSLYKHNVFPIFSLSAPYPLMYLFCLIWEKYSAWSRRQLPPVFNRRRCINDWRGNKYSNEKLKRLLGWKPKMDTREGLDKYFDYLRSKGRG